MTKLREDEHRRRAKRHKTVGDALCSAADDEWAAVAWFYSAYHVIKASLVSDPIWGDIKALHAINADLIETDRFVERHKGRKRIGLPREWGVNDLVSLLYKSASPAYERLHQASMLVRYGIGLSPGALPALATNLDTLLDLDAAGDLQAPILWTSGD